MTGRYRAIANVSVLLERDDGRILLLERANTGHADGQLCPPSGHLEVAESVVAAAIREAKEEVGVVIDPDDLHCVHVVHYRGGPGHRRFGFFFTTRRWQGEPVNREPRMCAGLCWVDPSEPPANTVASVVAALAQIAVGNSFSLDGW